jgi:hypothetical protein
MDARSSKRNRFPCVHSHGLLVALAMAFAIFAFSAPAAADCAGHCGGQAPDGCWCDNMCFIHGDCCNDICDHCNFISCDPDEYFCFLCGKQPGVPCWCDFECVIWGDCCDDVCEICDDQYEWCGAPRDSCTGLCNMFSGPGGECFCDADCHDRGDCCGDVCQTCGHCKPGDLNHDGVVDVADLLILFDQWGECPDPDDCPADLNGDGEVNSSDLLILFDNWG